MGGGETARIGIDRISDTSGVGAAGRHLKRTAWNEKVMWTLKMSGVREFGRAQSRWAQAQAIMTRRDQVREMDL